MVLLDSDVLIEIVRGKNQEISARWTELGRTETPVLYTPITEAELWAGARPPEFEALNELFQTFVCIPIDREAGRLAGEYLRQYGKSHGVHLGDALIAAVSILNGASLWTRNRKHCPMKELSFY